MIGAPPFAILAVICTGKKHRSNAPTKVNSLYRDAAEYDRSVGDYIFNLISSSDSDEYLKEYLEGVK